MTTPRRVVRILNVIRAEEGQSRIEGGMYGRADYALNPCGTCGSHCCQLRAYVNTAEALRIAYTLVIPLAEFVEVGKWKQEELDLRWGRPFQVDGEKCLLALKRSNQNHCFHLMRPGQPTSGCGIYSVRPAVCRLYPFNLGFDDGTSLGVGGQTKCPIYWLQNEGTVARAAEAYAEWQADLELDQRVVAAWNRGRRKDRSAGAFLTWLQGPGAELLGHNPEVFKPYPERVVGLFNQLKKLREHRDMMAAQRDG